ncbi:hypothetical protein [Planomonospora venezuelensis]|uniref:Uncharacterized protein n=1 Tax=Planomonospora venezuelensis TaxID=1999 RepID=A0A841D171_PLAVE|nr:hypothetical protein [Planomonospora venezuelensis]MBB5963239.1 hypothetical protein [Planomonospora venezuelensis]GIN01343.1 hypothetical protein Pve01_30010 [Planomonospora venezuelensis]
MGHPSDGAADARRRILEQTLAEVKARVEILEAALDPAHRRFTGQAVWVGPTARRFAEDLVARRARLRQAGQALVTTVEEELASTR